MSSGGSEDFYPKDEVKVYKDEGDDEKRSSENLSEEKFGLVTESEEVSCVALTSSFDLSRGHYERTCSVYIKAIRYTKSLVITSNLTITCALISG